jgi:hypothetical protein
MIILTTMITRMAITIIITTGICTLAMAPQAPKCLA